ncbi:MAG TPA: metalloregulator ArsR/SmtB family transcription factor [Caldisericia bacterium]|jgi:ArsR family transcriptional regulator|nr:metalloregulator ArsR/SmtB family transcription factor [Caldisericia bacterium]
MIKSENKELSEQDIRNLTDLFQALSSPLRLRILFYLMDGEHCACEFPDVINASQPNTSRNLDILKKAGLISFRREGQKMIYALSDARWIPSILSFIQKSEENLE